MSVSAMSVVFAVSCAVPGDGVGDPDGKGVVHGDLVDDPYEPANRVTWALNRRLNLALLEPVSDVYQAVMPKHLRRSIGNVRQNLGGPLRLTNQMLQGRWEDSGRESARFITNTTLGVGGIFDVASKMDLPGSRGNFNQTFRHWGLQPDTYLVLPMLGAADNVAAPGRVMDIAADPANYVSALQPVAYVTRFDQASEIAIQSAPVMRTEADSYALIRQAWPYLNRATDPDWSLRTAPDLASLESLGAVQHGPSDPRFLRVGKKHFVRLAHTGRDLPYNVWMQKDAAPLVFLNPGIGSHRESNNTLALAEAFYGMGFSVVTMSGIFHPEFMERGGSMLMPGNPSRDRADVLAACTAIDADVRRKYRRQEVTKRVLAGFSLGGFTAMQLAATEAEHAAGSVAFDHYLAIQSPVDLKGAYQTLDRYFEIPDSLSATERELRMDKLFHKTAAVFRGWLPEGVVPFDGDESRILIGYAFRMLLRDAMFSIHLREAQSGVSHKASRWNREPVYRELMAMSFDDYLTDWLRPMEIKNGTNEREMMRKINLRSMETALRSNTRVLFIGNRNDFLKSDEDILWLNGTLGARATWLPSGGHLGNIGDPAFLAVLEDVCEKFR